jgi:hypothetical protein
MSGCLRYTVNVSLNGAHLSRPILDVQDVTYAPLELLWGNFPFFRLVRGICGSLIRSNGAGKLGPRMRCRMVRASALFPSQLFWS